MPLKGRVRYRWRTTRSGVKQRLAFRGHKVVEVKTGKHGKAKRVR